MNLSQAGSNGKEGAVSRSPFVSSRKAPPEERDETKTALWETITATLHSVILMSRKAQVATKKIACDIDRRNRKVLFFCSIQQLSYLYIDNNTLTIKW